MTASTFVWFWPSIVLPFLFVYGSVEASVYTRLMLLATRTRRTDSSVSYTPLTRLIAVRGEHLGVEAVVGHVGGEHGGRVVDPLAAPRPHGGHHGRQPRLHHLDLPHPEPREPGAGLRQRQDHAAGGHHLRRLLRGGG